MTLLEHPPLSVASTLQALGPVGNEPQVRKWLARGVLHADRADGGVGVPIVEAIRALVLLDLQRTLGPTSGLAADIAAGLSVTDLWRLFESHTPTIEVSTDNGAVVFMPDPEVFNEFRGRLSHVRVQ